MQGRRDALTVRCCRWEKVEQEKAEPEASSLSNMPHPTAAEVSFQTVPVFIPCSRNVTMCFIVLRYVRSYHDDCYAKYRRLCRRVLWRLRHSELLLL